MPKVGAFIYIYIYSIYTSIVYEDIYGNIIYEKHSLFF